MIEPYYQEEDIIIYNNGCLEVLKEIPDESVDLIITDPPYNIGDSNKLTKVGNTITTNKEAWGEWDNYDITDYDNLIFDVISESYRLLKNGGSLYMFTNRRDIGYFIRHAIQKGFMYANLLAIVKQNPLPHFRKNNWRSAFELCMYLTKGKPKTFNFLSQDECINTYYYMIGQKETSHPTEKPKEFIAKLVKVSSNKGDLVLDPFLGSGTTARACKDLSRKCIGIEISEEYIKMAIKRLGQEVLNV